MKFSLVALSAMVAFATINVQALPTFGKGALYEDIKYFTDMIPTDKISKVIVKYLTKDAEFQELVKYARSNDFKQLVQEVEAIPEFHDFANYMQSHGVYMNDMLNRINKMMGLPSFQPTVYLVNDIRGGLKGLFLDIKELISYDDIIHGYAYKMRTSEAFRDFVALLKSEGHQNFVNTLYKNQRYLNLRAMLVQKGLDITLVEDVIFTVLGIQFPAVNAKSSISLFDNKLSKDIHDFMDLIDMDKVIKIVSAYVDDDQVQEALKYFRSDEFHVLVHKVEDLKAYQHLVIYLHDAGLDIYGLIQKIHKLFGMEDYVPPSGNRYFGFYANRGGMKAMIDEIIDSLPVNDLKAMFQQKMKTSPDFKNFVEMLQSDEFQQIVNTIYKEPVFLEMRQMAIDFGLDLTRAREVLEEIGIKLPKVNTKSSIGLFDNKLSKDIHDFMDLIDMDKIIKIVSAYVDDDQVQEALKYFRSDEFHVLVHKVEDLKAYQHLVIYLNDAGLDIYGLIQKIHKLFGMEDYVPPSGNGYFGFYANRGGVKAMIDEIIDSLPVNDLKAMFQQKMKTSPDFKNFVEMLQSDEFQQIVNTIYKEPIFLEMRQKAIDFGLDLKRAREVLEEIGIKLPTVNSKSSIGLFDNKLSKDIHDFMDLIDMDKIIKIVSAYVDDDQVQEALKYFRSDEFHVLVHKVEDLKAYQHLVIYLNDAGLDIYGLIQKIHKLFGMEDYVPPSGNGYFGFYANRGGVKAMIDEIIDSLPVNDLKAMFQQKMKTSPDFKNFVEMLQSDEFQQIVNTIYSEPIFLEMRQKAIDFGLDLQRAREVLEEIGIKLPHPSFY